VCDLIHEVVTGSTEHLLDKLRVLIDWVMQLHDNYSQQARCNNPQSGFVKVIASILWKVQTQQQLPELPLLISSSLFETCFEWVSSLEHDEPLKSSFDSLLCALCYIKPELFNQLLVKLGVKLEPTMMSSGCFFSLKSNMVLDDPQTIADAVFSLMITLSDKASNPRLVVAPICQYLEESKIDLYLTSFAVY